VNLKVAYRVAPVVVTPTRETVPQVLGEGQTAHSIDPIQTANKEIAKTRLFFISSDASSDFAKDCMRESGCPRANDPKISTRAVPEGEDIVCSNLTIFVHRH
jgi:hypothetical protein